MAHTKLTDVLRKSIVASAQATRDFDAVTAATGVSSERLNQWIQRGAREKTGIYTELLEDIKPFLSDMCRRQMWTTVSRFFEQLGAMAERDKKFERILTVWFNRVWLNDLRVRGDRRNRLATQLAKALGRPIHPGRWSLVKGELARLSRLHQRTSGSELEDLMVRAVFFAADILKQPEDPPSVPEQIFYVYQGMRRLTGNLLTEDLAGPGWRKKKVKMEHKDEGSSPAVDDQFAQEARVREREELRQFVLKRLAILARKTPRQVADIMDRHPPKDITELAEKLGTTRLAIYRKVIDPTRK